MEYIFMAPGNYFLNMGNITFGNLPCFQAFSGWSFNFCNFSMPTFTNPFTFNFNAIGTFYQNPYINNDFNIFSNNINYNFNTPTFATNTNFQTRPTIEFNSKPISIGDSYSPSSIATYNTPTYTYSNRTTSPSSSKSTSSTKSTPATSTKPGSLADYNADSGQKLADIAMRNAGYVIDPTTKKITTKTKDPDEFTSYCTRYVKAAIRDAGLGEYTNTGSAYQMTSDLRRNKNFREISSSTPLRDVPAGSILIYDRGVAGYSSEHGHIEIKTDDGRAVSDGITDNLYKRPSHIFMPV